MNIGVTPCSECPSDTHDIEVVRDMQNRVVAVVWTCRVCDNTVWRPSSI